jgi:protein-disulfide isomerase
VTATPTFFINGQKIEGAASYAEFKTLIDAAIAAGS